MSLEVMVSLHLHAITHEMLYRVNQTDILARLTTASIKMQEIWNKQFRTLDSYDNESKLHSTTNLVFVNDIMSRINIIY